MFLKSQQFLLGYSNVRGTSSMAAAPLCLFLHTFFNPAPPYIEKLFAFGPYPGHSVSGIAVWREIAIQIHHSYPNFDLTISVTVSFYLPRF